MLVGSRYLHALDAQRRAYVDARDMALAIVEVTTAP